MDRYLERMAADLDDDVGVVRAGASPRRRSGVVDLRRRAEVIGLARASLSLAPEANDVAPGGVDDPVSRVIVPHLR